MHVGKWNGRFRRLAEIAIATITAQSKSMKLVRLICAIAVLLLPLAPSCAEQPNSALQVGDTFELTMLRESSSKGSDGSSSSTHDKDTLVERVVAVRPDGLELVYDLPDGASAEERTDNWQLPARVFEPLEGQPQLLNLSELETRRDAWLKIAKLPNEACGHWIFTWNAFRIECDPQSVLGIIEAYDLRVPGLRGGALFRDVHGLEPAPLSKGATGQDGTSYTAELVIDPDAIRRENAESDVVVGEIMREPVTLEEALRKHAKEDVSGTISVTLYADATGNVRRRLKVEKIETKTPDGTVETRTVTETLERKLISYLKT